MYIPPLEPGEYVVVATPCIFVFDRKHRLVYFAHESGALLHFPPKTYKLLSRLAQCPNVLVSTTELAELLEAYPTTIGNTMRTLRATLKKYGCNPISTTYEEGLTFHGDIIRQPYH